MTITMSTQNFPNALSSGPELGREDLQEFVNLGLLTKTDNHKEHFAINPSWANDPASGILYEINRHVLGRWNNKLNAYVVAVKNIRNVENSAAMNEDHRWLHIDIVATYYSFCPVEGQRMKGEIKKVGNRAAICIIFDVFTATVFSEDESELTTWNVGDQLRFEIYSFMHRRKGPIIRAKSLSVAANSSSKKKRKLPILEGENFDCEAPVDESNNTENSLYESGDLEESRSSRKAKKKKKIKIKQEVDDSIEYNYVQDINNSLGHEDDDNDTEINERKKKKKKKKSSHSE